jgi:hypothetical protein
VIVRLGHWRSGKLIWGNGRYFWDGSRNMGHLFDQKSGKSGDDSRP